MYSLTFYVQSVNMTTVQKEGHNMTAQLSGKTAVVTGSSSGIGRAIAEKLGSAGAHVYLAGRTMEAMEASKAKIEAAGGKATPVVLDMRDVKQVQSLVERAEEETGHVDIMVNNAGVSHPGTIADADPEGWREMLETNILGLLAGSQAAIGSATSDSSVAPAAARKARAGFAITQLSSAVIGSQRAAGSRPPASVLVRVRQQAQVARALDRDRELPLVERPRAGDAARHAPHVAR